VQGSELPDIVAMVQPSAATTAVFVLIVVSLVVLLVLGVARAGQTGEPRAHRRKWTLTTAAGAAAWLAITGWFAASGVLETKMLPPPAVIFMVICLGLAAVLALSRLGTRLVHGTPIAALVGFQAFRLPLELVLHQWWKEGVLPVQMTFEGHNFDIVTGGLAIVVALWAWRGKAPREVILGFNLIGLTLLVTVTTIAVLSTPLPLRRYMNDPPVLLPFNFPFVWIVPICVGGALFGHLLVFRWLRVNKRGHYSHA
jgi:hypothetical protein